MALTYGKFFQPVVLGTSAGTVYTVPTVPTATLLRAARIRLTNTTAVAATASVNIVPVAGTPVAGNSILTAKAVPANDYIDIDVPTMAAGDFISALAGTATSITMHFVTGVLFA